MSIKTWLENENIEFLENFDFSKRSWIKVGKSNTLLNQNLNELTSLLNYFKSNKIKFYTLGNISNVIVRDGLIKTPIVNLNNYNKIEILREKDDEILIKVNSGVSMNKLVKFLTEKGIYNLSGSVGIPGTVGGAIFMNASSFEDQLSNYVHEVESLNEDGNLEIFKKKECAFKWRSSIFKNKKNIITNTILFFKKKQKYLKKKKTKEKIYFEEKLFQKMTTKLRSLFATRDLYKDIKNVAVYYILYL